MKYYFFLSFLLLSTFSFGQGGGLILYEVGNTGIGNANAGASALARDASSAYTNPATLTELKQNYLSFGLELLPITIDANITSPTNNGQGTTDQSGGSSSPSAAIYWAHKLNDKFTLGGTVNAVAASSLNYDTNWIGRYIITDVMLGVVNIAPAAGYRLNDQWSFGLALNCYYTFADVNLRLANPQADPITNYETDYKVNLDVTDFTFGFTAGIHYRPTEETRLGLTYRMGNTLEYDGNAAVTDINDTELSYITKITAEIPIVNGINLGVAQRFGHFDVLADIGWADWSKFEDIPVTVQLNDNIEGALPEDWNDSWHFALGANYYLEEDWTFQVGISHDTATADDEAQTINVPSWSLTRFTAGAIYNLNDKFDLGIHYSYGAADEGGEFSMLDDYSSLGIETFTGSYDKVSLQCILLSFSYKY